ncbi:hypothetical protein [Streptomyces cinereoruber]|uniref:hypothetical protein n=1 Tax=Streptomyces cinereoruber TaxID=67260 RepID=UPI00362E0D4B
MDATEPTSHDTPHVGIALSTDFPGIQTIDPASSAAHKLVIAFDGRPLVTLDTETGEMTFGPDYTPDTAAKAFWDAVGTVGLRPARQATGQADTTAAPWTADDRHGPTPEEAATFLRCMATEHPIVAHCCKNCDGIDPDTCLTNPDRASAVGQSAAAAPDTDQAVYVDPARVRIINHPGVLATADTEIAALLDEYAADVRSATLREAMNDLCAFGHGEAAAFLLRKTEAAGETR